MTTIPEDTIRRAAEAAAEAETENIFERCDCETCMEQRVAGLNAALPILRDAIRAELVEEMYQDAVRKELYVGHYNGHIDVHDDPLADWLRTFLPESEPQP